MVIKQAFLIRAFFQGFGSKLGGEVVGATAPGVYTWGLRAQEVYGVGFIVGAQFKVGNPIATSLNP